MNASTVLVLVERHKLDQNTATGMQLALGQNSASVVVVMCGVVALVGYC